MHSFTCAIPWERIEDSTVIGSHFGSTVFADAFFFVRMLCRNELPFKVVGDNFYFWNSESKHSWGRTWLAAYVCIAVSSRRVWRICAVPASCKRRGSVNANTEVKLPFLHSSILASSTLTTFSNRTALSCTIQSENVYMFSENSLNFAASCSVEIISTEPVSREIKMFLWPLQEARDAVASAKKRTRTANHKGGWFNKFQENKLVINKNKGGEIGAAWLRHFSTRKSRAYVQKERYHSVVQRPALGQRIVFCA